jgi:hypothetical protein
MRLSQIRRLVVLAAEARGVMVLHEEAIPEEKRYTAMCVTKDGTDVRVQVVKTGGPDSTQPWLVSNGDGEQWSAGDVPDAMTHAVGEALGDKEEAA